MVGGPTCVGFLSRHESNGSEGTVMDRSWIWFRPEIRGLSFSYKNASWPGGDFTYVLGGWGVIMGSLFDRYLLFSFLRPLNNPNSKWDSKNVNKKAWKFHVLVTTTFKFGVQKWSTPSFILICHKDFQNEHEKQFGLRFSKNHAGRMDFLPESSITRRPDKNQNWS